MHSLLVHMGDRYLKLQGREMLGVVELAEEVRVDKSKVYRDMEPGRFLSYHVTLEKDPETNKMRRKVPMEIVKDYRKFLRGGKKCK